MRINNTFLIAVILFAGCHRNGDLADAYGNFESEDVIVAAESQGRIMEFPHSEGDRLEKDQFMLLIDTTQLHLKKEQLLSGKNTLRSREQTLFAQIRVTEIQADNARRELKRVSNLVKGGAATEKQLDDMNGNIDLVEARLNAQKSQQATLVKERETLGIQIAQVNDLIEKCSVKSPLEGTILAKYKKAGELVAPGQALCKIADLDELILRAYVSGNQLAGIRIGDSVEVRTDGSEKTNKWTGAVTWISPQAEFTPKIIQTKEERVDLVYAIKVSVPNDGSLKIGMPGEIVFP